MNIPKITKDEYLDSIKNGIKEAIHEMMESGNGYNGPIIREWIVEEIGKHISKAVFSALTQQE